MKYQVTCKMISRKLVNKPHKWALALQCLVQPLTVSPSEMLSQKSVTVSNTICQNQRTYPAEKHQGSLCSTNITWEGKLSNLFNLVLKSWTATYQLLLNIYHCRVTKQRLREAKLLAVDFLILGLAGICLGTIAKLSDKTFGMPGYIYTIIAVCKFWYTCITLFSPRAWWKVHWHRLLPCSSFVQDCSIEVIFTGKIAVL